MGHHYDIIVAKSIARVLVLSLSLSLSLSALSPTLCAFHDGAAIGAKSSSLDKPLVPGLFVFGDSIVDPGNNNDLLTLAKSDYYPYGMDFVGGAITGRFSNGYTPADFMALKLGLPLIPAYNHPGTKGKKILHGVNFASGGSGIDSMTGKLIGQLFSLEDQIEQLWKTKEQLICLIGAIATDKLLARSVFLVVAGSNDWLSYFNVLIPNVHFTTLSESEHGDRLIQKLISHIKAIYEAGGRRIVVAGTPALGCCPSRMLEYNTNGSCVSNINDAVSAYNDRLRPEILALNGVLPGARLTYINIYDLVLDAAMHPARYGFKTGNVACCGIGKFHGFITCVRGMKPCDDVEDHLFWDAYHPTSKFYPHLIDALWNNGPPYTYPRSLRDEFEGDVNIHTEL